MKHQIRFMVAIGFAAVFGLAVGAQQEKVPASAAQNPPSAEEKSPRFVANKKEVSTAQEILKGKGLYDGPVDGKRNPELKLAVRMFQVQNKLKATGALNRETLEKLGVKIQERKSKTKTSTQQTP